MRNLDTDYTSQVVFTVVGEPIPQGSMKAFVPKGWNRAVLTSDNPRLKSWRLAVASAALSFRGIYKAADYVPIRIRIAFCFVKPKSAPRSRLAVTVKPDLDKLCRAVLDALKGVLYEDDSQVTELQATKCYGPQAQAQVTMEALRWD